MTMTFEQLTIEQILRLPESQRAQLAAYAIDPRAAAEAPKHARGVAKCPTHLKLVPELRAALDSLKIAAQVEGIAASTGTGITAAWSVVFAAGLRAILLGESILGMAKVDEQDEIRKALELPAENDPKSENGTRHEQ